ncbi:MAG: glycerate kinase [Desulfuromonadales bacterium]
MKIVIAPDSFKESLTSIEAANQIEAGFREVLPSASYIKIPVADGGEGTVEAMVNATGGSMVDVSVTGPLGDRIPSSYGVLGDESTAVIEMAAASGLALVPVDRRNPLLTTSYGTGELIRHALDAGLRKFIVGIGGSATNDAGVGMLQALGARFLDRQGREIAFGGGALADLERIDCSEFDQRLQECHTLVACDVENPLTGPNGASAVFGPQKGADQAAVAQLDANLCRFSELVARDIGKQVADLPGAGAAGGMGAALQAFLNAELRPGIQIVIKAVGLEEAIVGADLVVTGEGRIDGQSVHGKAPVGVARIAARHGVPVIGIAGSLGPGSEKVKEHGISALFCMVKGPCSLPEALAGAAENLCELSKNVAATIKLFQPA